GNRLAADWVPLRMFAAQRCLTERHCTPSDRRREVGRGKAKHLAPEALATAARAHADGGGAAAWAANGKHPNVVRDAIHIAQMAVASVVGTSRHRRLCRREGVAYMALCPMIFAAPNMAYTKQPLFIRVDRQAFRPDNGVRGTGVPAGAAASSARGAFWAAQAFRGKMAAHGRASLRPHILAWSCALSTCQLARALRRRLAAPRERLGKRVWTCAMAMESACQSSAQGLPRRFGNVDCRVELLRFSAIARDLSRFDGDRETFLETVDQEPWRGPDLPLRVATGRELTLETAPPRPSSSGMAIDAFAVGKCPARWRSGLVFQDTYLRAGTSSPRGCPNRLLGRADGQGSLESGRSMHFHLQSPAHIANSAGTAAGRFNLGAKDLRRASDLAA
ncbi:unnamed protein product, partial [Prorocentrum cordatum]